MVSFFRGWEPKRLDNVPELPGSRAKRSSCVAAALSWASSFGLRVLSTATATLARRGAKQRQRFECIWESKVFLEISGLGGLWNECMGEKTICAGWSWDELPTRGVTEFLFIGLEIKPDRGEKRFAKIY